VLLDARNWILETTRLRMQNEIRRREIMNSVLLDMAFPRNILLGNGVFGRLGLVAGRFGKKALLVCGQSALKKSGRLEEAIGLLTAEGMEAVVFEGVENDPSLDTCRRGIAMARERGCDMVVGIGGGSALDAGKAIAVIAPGDGDIADYFHGKKKISLASLPVVAVPTTAGTGTECTPNAVLTDAEKGVKKSLRHESMIPDAALVDPELTLTCPPSVTAHCGMDALTQAIECYVSKAANPVSDALALRAVELLAGNLEKAFTEPDRIEHREPVALGSLMTAMAFANARLGAVHGLAHPIGLHFHVPHGLVCAVLLPHVCEFNIPARPEKFGDIAKAIGAANAEEVPSALLELNGRLNIPPTLRDYGFTEAAIAEKVLPACRTGSMAANPRDASDDDLAQILRKIA